MTYEQKAQEWEHRIQKEIAYVVIDRPKGTTHPKYPSMVYKVDYGYLENTKSMDGDGIDIWNGTDSKQEIDAIMCIVDLQKRDSEIKILIGCTEDDWVSLGLAG